MQTTLLKNLYLLTRFDKPIGILLLLWPTLWGVWIAGNGRPEPLVLVVFVLGTILMRAAGCIINDITDRHIDNKVKRTKARPLAANNLALWQALLAFVVFSLLAFGLVLLLNRLTIIFAIIGMGFAIIYPFLKRITHLSQAWLGIAFSWGIPMAFAAEQNTIPAIGWFLFFIAAIWSVAYDTFYAMVDRDDDLRIGVKSTAILLGKNDRLVTAILQTGMLALLIIFGLIMRFNYWYYSGLFFAASLMLYQQYLIKDRIREKCFQAFLNNNWVGLVIFAGIILNFIYQT